MVLLLLKLQRWKEEKFREYYIPQLISRLSQYRGSSNPLLPCYACFIFYICSENGPTNPKLLVWKLGYVCGCCATLGSACVCGGGVIAVSPWGLGGVTALWLFHH